MDCAIYTVEREDHGSSLFTGGALVFWTVKRNGIPVYWTTGGPELANAYIAAREGAGHPIPWPRKGAQGATASDPR